MTAANNIWVVDDDRSIRWVVERALTRAGFDCRTFQSADSLLSAIHTDAPDIVISDIRMPGTDGLELLGQLKESHPELPVIITTALILGCIVLLVGIIVFRLKSATLKLQKRKDVTCIGRKN